MAFCSQCGTQMQEGAAFCPHCGHPTGAAQSVVVEPSFSQADISQHRPLAILGYFGLLFLIPLLAAKHSPYAQHHAKQAGNLCILSAIAGGSVSILSALFSKVIGLNVLVWLTSFGVGTAITALTVLGIVFAAKGSSKPLPVIGSIRFIQ